MAAISTISSKGQVTVPVEVRRRLGLKVGDRVSFSQEHGETVLRVVRRGEGNPFEKFMGALAPGMPEGTAKGWVRSLRDEEDPDAI